MNKDELIALDDRGIAAWDTHDVDAFAAMFADGFAQTDDTVQGAMASLDQVREYMSGWFTAFPDMKVKEQNRVVGDDAVAAEVEFTGTEQRATEHGWYGAAGDRPSDHGSWNLLCSCRGWQDHRIPCPSQRRRDDDAAGPSAWLK